jgi:hypothetical protein
MVPTAKATFIISDALEFGRIFTPYFLVRIDGQNGNVHHLPLGYPKETLAARYIG